MATIKKPKKLIEVALPLDKINKASAAEKTIRHGHPSNLHRWWARRPQVSARAVIFAQMVNDPGYQQGGGFKYGVNKEKAEIERERLFKIIEELVIWEKSNDPELLARASAEIWRSWRETCDLNKFHPEAKSLFDPERLPDFHDPFAGGGALPLEAQRLGLVSHASDLNPVAVMINKAMIEIPPKFAGTPPVGPRRITDKQQKLAEDWSSVKGIVEDVRRYGAWMRNEAEKRIGHLYPLFEVTEEVVSERPDLKIYLGQKLKIINWIWARTVRSPNPAFSSIEVPLVTSFVLSNKSGNEAYVEPIIKNDKYRFSVKSGIPPDTAKLGTKLARGANFKCILSNAPIEQSHVCKEGNAGRLGEKLMAIVAEGVRGRVYLTPTDEQEKIARSATPQWIPELAMPENPRWFSPPIYGFKTYGQIFTARQLVALTTLSDLVQEAVTKCRNDAIAFGMNDDGKGLNVGGDGATAYAESIGIYLALALSKSADSNNALCPWEPVAQCSRQLFGRQAMPMLWDFAEANPLLTSSGGFLTNIEGSVRSFNSLAPHGKRSYATQEDAAVQTVSEGKVISTDPPYYDNIGYADLSDFFYIWLRRSLKEIFPQYFATVAVPKAEELVATPYRHGGKAEAESFFLNGMTRAMHSLAVQAHPAFPVTIYYAFKQSDTEANGTASTGWETFLAAVLEAGFCITGTWPMRTEMTAALKANTNSLASSVVLVCQKRESDAPTISRREFIREINATLPEALLDMTRGGINSPVAPVDLSQAIIGPGMAIFSRYSSVLESDGKPMSVRSALQLINRFLGEDDFDHDTQFCLHWFDEQGWAEGKFGDADVLARAKGTSVKGLQESGVVDSGAGKLRLLRWAELPRDWSPEQDLRTPIWESLHQLIRALNQDGEATAGSLLARMPARAEPMRALSYRLYTLCERKGWAEEARAYNELVAAWSSIEQAATEAGIRGSQAKLDI
jgi:putative DNA methylase